MNNGKRKIDSILTNPDEIKEDESPSKGLKGGEERMRCPYLDTINRQMLDFDAEMVREWINNNLI